MRIYRIVSTALGGVFMAGMSTSAFAGCGGNTYCGPAVPPVMAYEGVQSASCMGPVVAPNCNPGVSVYGNSVDHLSSHF